MEPQVLEREPEPTLGGFSSELVQAESLHNRGYSGEVAGQI
ncbi:hypothetical protein E2C01_079040 [Portunus trituberculatus]|uniref:Uncharacterized protein n=1 Tax=Portunus trituberculatus TaxID=210409 RepID=A0A5B7IPJ8_PORTR|nr:hypothetical protein [Portunus trituberculatus]